MFVFVPASQIMVLPIVYLEWLKFAADGANCVIIYKTLPSAHRIIPSRFIHRVCQVMPFTIRRAAASFFLMPFTSRGPSTRTR